MSLEIIEALNYTSVEQCCDSREYFDSFKADFKLSATSFNHPNSGINWDPEVSIECTTFLLSRIFCHQTLMT